MNLSSWREILVVAVAFISMAGGILSVNDAPYKVPRPAELRSDNSTASRNIPVRPTQDPFEKLSTRRRQETEPDSRTSTTTPQTPTIGVQTQATPVLPPWSSLIADIANRRKAQDISPKPGGFLFVPIMVDGTTSADAKEKRGRMRYAIGSALAEAGYIAEDLPHYSEFPISYADKTKYFQPVSYEWYIRNPLMSQKLSEGDNPGKAQTAFIPNRILLMWVPDEEMSRPLYDVFSLIDSLSIWDKVTPKKNFIPRICVFGPSGTSALRHMMMESPVSLAGIQSKVFSPLESLLNQIDPASTQPKESLPYLRFTEFLSFCSTKSTASDALLMKTITQDAVSTQNEPDPMDRVPYIVDYEQTIGLPPWREKGNSVNQSIIRSFAQRGVQLKMPIPSDDQLMSYMVNELYLRIPNLRDKKAGKILLISESDTYYGRSLPETFAIKFRNFVEKCDLSAEAFLKTPVGIEDPRIVRFSYFRGLDEAVEPKATGSPSADPKAAGALQIERPEGDGQLDYLRRRSRAIHEHEFDQGGILAVGILGSDLYDKLLVMQAVRPCFSDAIFFTTDLNANFSHPDFSQWTRNLLVVSGFGLQPRLNPHLDKLSFRDGYQTAAYLALLDMLNGKISDRPEYSPAIFEIGRDSAIALKPSWSPILIDSDRRFEPEEPGPVALRHPSIYLPLAFSVLLVVFACFIVRNDRRRFAIAAICLLSMAGLCVWLILCLQNGIEPFTWTKGISIWPTEIIRIVVISLAIFSLFLMNQLIRKSNTSIELSMNLDKARDDFFQWDGLWQILQIDQARILKKQQRESDKDLDSPSNKKKQRIDPNLLWQTHVMQTSFLANLPAIIAVFTAVLLIFSIWHGCSGNDPVPTRDGHWLNFFIVHAAIVAVGLQSSYCLLLVWAHVQFINSLRRRESLWPINSIMDAKKKHHIPVGCIQEWLDLQWISKRTRPVVWFILFPFISSLILAVSRNHHLDNWGSPIVAMSLHGIILLLMVGCTVWLQKSAEFARRSAIDKFKQALRSSLTRKQTERSAVIEHLIKQAEGHNGGAFAPITSQPVMVAIFLPLGVIGVNPLVNMLLYR